jgi:hypothetical protein
MAVILDKDTRQEEKEFESDGVEMVFDDKDMECKLRRGGAIVGCRGVNGFFVCMDVLQFDELEEVRDTSENRMTTITTLDDKIA